MQDVIFESCEKLYSLKAILLRIILGYVELGSERFNNSNISEFR